MSCIARVSYVGEPASVGLAQPIYFDIYINMLNNIKGLTQSNRRKSSLLLLLPLLSMRMS